LIRYSNLVFGSYFNTDCKILHLKKICHKIYVSLLHIVAAEHLIEPLYAHRKLGTAGKKEISRNLDGFCCLLYSNTIFVCVVANRHLWDLMYCTTHLIEPYSPEISGRAFYAIQWWMQAASKSSQGEFGRQLYDTTPHYMTSKRITNDKLLSSKSPPP